MTKRFKTTKHRNGTYTITDYQTSMSFAVANEQDIDKVIKILSNARKTDTTKFYE